MITLLIFFNRGRMAVIYTLSYASITITNLITRKKQRLLPIMEFHLGAPHTGSPRYVPMPSEISHFALDHY